MNPRRLTCALVLAVAVSAHARLRPVRADDRSDVLLADFEGHEGLTWDGDWTVTGDAFGPGPARGTLPNQMPVTGFKGKGLVNSYHGGDKSTGTLTSRQFTVDRKYLAFLIGGGGFEGKTCINLLVDGKPVRSATGPNTRPGGSEVLAPHSWDVAEFDGKPARIEIVDAATGGWGHINVDQIVLTDRKPPEVLRDVKREVTLDGRYLNLPVKTGAPKRRMSVLVGGEKVREFEIELAPAEPDFWSFLDVSPWKGKPATLVVDALPEDSTGLKSADVADAIKGTDDLYREALRPQFHFSSRRGWLNDPNGLVFSKGEWHLFYQHNPYGWDWGNMHWGHAVSSDLVRWQELPIALYPKKYGDWAFSGSALVDRDNTSGFKKGDEDTLVLAYTSTSRGECIAYSNDRGRTWQEFAGYPVVKHQGRDPRLLWHGPTNRWVMAVYDEADRKQWIAFYTSPDLKAWEYASRIEGFFECPDLFELPVDGDAAKTKWVLTAASSEYRVGTFDGREFKPETPKLPGHRGDAMYAAQTYSDVPDGRRVQIGWGRVATPGAAFNQMMMFPCDLSLRTTPDGPRLAWSPAREIESLRAKSHSWKDLSVKEGENPLAAVAGDLLDVTAEFEPGTAAEVGLRARGLTIAYDPKKQELACGGRMAPLPLTDGLVRLRVLVDRTSVEVFAGDGLVYMPMSAPRKGGAAGCEVYAKGEAKVGKLEVHQLRSAWPEAGGRP